MAFIGIASIAFVSAMVGLLLAVLILYISRILSLKDLEKVWKAEVVESVISLLLIILIFVILIPYLEGSLRDYVEALYGGSLPPLSGYVADAVRDTPSYIVLFRLSESEKYLEEIRKIAVAFMAMARGSKVSYTVGNTPFIGLGFGIVAALNANLYNNVLNLIYLYLLSKKIFLIMPLVAELMIPLGVAFRAFPPTRGMGAYLISFGISFYLLFPFFLLALMGPMPPEEYESLLSPTVTGPILSTFEKMGELFHGATNTPLIKDILNLGSPFLLGPHVVNAVTLSTGAVMIAVDIEQTINLLLSLNRLMGLAVVDLLFAPYAAFGLALASTNILSTILGGKIAEIGRGLVKFI